MTVIGFCHDKRTASSGYLPLNAAVKDPGGLGSEFRPWQPAASIFSCLDILCTARLRSRSGQCPFRPLAQLLRRAAHPDEELAERRIFGAHLVKPHLVDQLLEYQGIGRKQIHAPLPVIEAD